MAQLAVIEPLFIRRIIMSDFSRTELLIGKENMNILKNSSVAVFGIGGVGSYVAEALARCGIGKIMLVDNDTVSPSNVNRQLIALNSTIGLTKTEVMMSRINDINPECDVSAHNIFYTSADDIDLSGYDYIVDAIDTVTSKLVLISEAKRLAIPIISSMGTGNKLDASRFRIADISKTSVCPLARVMRKELKDRNIKNVKVLYSDEPPITPSEVISDGTRRQVPASIAFVPSVAGLMIAGEVIRDLIE